VLAVLASIDPVDAKTFELKLKKPYPNLLFALGSGIGQIPVIMRARDLDGDPSKPVTTSIGSGPFKFNREARVSGALTVFDRNPDYVPRSEPADGLSGGRLAKVDPSSGASSPMLRPRPRRCRTARSISGSSRHSISFRCCRRRPACACSA
jgi:ABC-type transport system substrate-binding protein